MIAFIDCYLDSPANHCVNYFNEQNNIISTYHIASKYGLESLKELESKPTAYIILGSASNVTTPLQWHLDLANFIDQQLKNNIPTLGICFGHQLMASFYGSKVNFIDKERTYLQEVREIEFISRFSNYKPHQKTLLSFAHAQIIKNLSDAFIPIAKSEKFKNEIIKHKELPFIGIQAHPEASRLFLKKTVELDNCSKDLLSNGQNFLREFYKYAQSISN